MAIIEPLDLSREERQKFHTLLDKLTEVIGQEAEQPEFRPALRLLPSSRSGVITQTPELEGNRMPRDPESLKEGIVVPFDLSREERQQFHTLLSELTEAIWQPKPKPDLRLVK